MRWSSGSCATRGSPATSATFLLVNDLVVLILRDRLGDVLGVDPLSTAGMRRWSTEVLTIYRDGLGGTDDSAQSTSDSSPTNRGTP